MNTSLQTQKFLRLLSRRLSGREDCKGVEFVVGIGKSLDTSRPNESKQIFFKPDVSVFRDLHHRKDKDIFRVADLVITKNFPGLIQGRDEYGQLIVDTDVFNEGVYKYQKSFDGKRRRWVKMNRY